MKFLVDNQLPVKLTQWLMDNGSEAEHVLDLVMAKTTDIEIWTLAISKEMIVVSEDVDFFLLANRPADSGRLLWVRVGNCRTNSLWRVFRSHGRPF